MRTILYKIIKKIIPEVKYLKYNIPWLKLVDYKSDTEIGENTKISSPFNIQNSQVDSFTYIEQNSFISNTKIGKFCSIGPNLFCGWGIHPTDGISTSPLFYSTKKQVGLTLSKTNKIEERKPIIIGNDVFIGANVTILDGVVIGDGAIVGAGAVVSKDIPPYAIAAGSPIKIMRYRFKDEQIEDLLKIRWWDFLDENLLEVENLFFDVDQFIEKYKR